MSAETSATPAAPVTPLPERAAIAILGSMIFLILTLIAVLVQTTWIAPAASGDPIQVESEHLAWR